MTLCKLVIRSFLVPYCPKCSAPLALVDGVYSCCNYYCSCKAVDKRNIALKYPYFRYARPQRLLHILKLIDQGVCDCREINKKLPERLRSRNPRTISNDKLSLMALGLLRDNGSEPTAFGYMVIAKPYPEALRLMLVSARTLVGWLYPYSHVPEIQHTVSNLEMFIKRCSEELSRYGTV